MWYCVDRDIFVPKFATLARTANRIYLKPKWAESILRKGRVFDTTKKNDMRAYSLSKKINVPWVKPVYSGPPTSLPDF